MEFNQVKCWVPHFGHDDLLQHYSLEEEWLQSCLVEKDLEMLNMSQCGPGGQEDQWDPGLDQRQCGQQDKGRDCSPVLSAGEAAS